MKRRGILSVFVCLVLVFSLIPTYIPNEVISRASSAQDFKNNIATVSSNNIGTELKDYAVHCIQASVTDPKVGSMGGEWAVLTLGKTGSATDEFKNKYRASVKSTVSSATNGKLNSSRATDNERVMIALSAIGDSVVVDGVDLADPLYDFSYTTKQGINGAIYGLIALDMSGYYKVTEAENQTSAEDPVSVRDDLLRFILGRELSGGGWVLGAGTNPDPDITFMVIQALAPYYTKDASVKAAVDRALAVMSEKQDENGGFSTASSMGATASSESVSQAITALASLGIDPGTDTRFIKNNKSLVDNLLSYKVSGGFAHTGTAYNQMATEQAAYACVALWLLDSGKHLYDRSGEIYRAPAGTPTPIPSPTITPSAAPTIVPTATPSATPTSDPTPTVSPQTKINGVTYEEGKSGAVIKKIPNKVAVSIKSTVEINGKNVKVTTLAKGACNGLSKTKKLKITTKYLKKVEKGSLSGLNINAVIYLPKKKYKAYKKLIIKKGTGYKKTMRIKKI